MKPGFLEKNLVLSFLFSLFRERRPYCFISARHVMLKTGTSSRFAKDRENDIECVARVTITAHSGKLYSRNTDCTTESSLFDKQTIMSLSRLS